MEPIPRAPRLSQGGWGGFGTVGTSPGTCIWPGCSAPAARSHPRAPVGVLMVVMLISPMMLGASLSTWCMHSISLHCCAYSADPSISMFLSPCEYRVASSSKMMNSLVMKSHTVLLTKAT